MSTLDELLLTNVCQRRESVVVWTVNGQVVNCLGSFIFKVLSQVNHLEGRSHVLLGNTPHPMRESCREEHVLDLLGSFLLDGS
jgi:hypothetical protein